ncbi:carboxylesterase family protein [Actinoplanes sp. TBRC 11911]|uniref:hypothetical protein n=1 Tax=Actinoplanes sp. TBRC 11911 TaxID=2729386 RepID=UPI00145EDF33|nr:hypothetical protein [Actinoplanes sp. TBRC 11911]NMO50072.1 carboxylesterase family protein [Actinoplanes sp. TBRC 11911]
MSFPTGAYHTAELPYLSDVDFAGESSAAMVGCWTAFARHGSAWTPFDIRSGNVQRFASEPGGATGFARDHQVALWRACASLLRSA